MSRTDRVYNEPRPKIPPPGERTAGQRDHDRILYSAAFRRLANVTQVVAADQGAFLHNRLTHTLKVAQLGRRLAERLLAREEDRERIEALGGLDADVVEAACLAHDLGHPPFGHVAEEELNRLADAAGARGGFEGNAQSFRIVTKLAVRDEEQQGLNLSRATLNALLKYPWLRDANHSGRKHKWGAYHTETKELEFARGGEHDLQQADKTHLGDVRRSLEAELMDLADDIAYSIYDVEDFYRAGKIPLDRLFAPGRSPGQPSDEAEKFFDEVFSRWRTGGRPFTDTDAAKYRQVFTQIASGAQGLFAPAYIGSRKQRGKLRAWTSSLVGRYVRAIDLQRSGNPADRRVQLKPDEKAEISILKELTWHYVITDPGLGTQQHGYRRIIETLFNALLDSAKGDGYLMPQLRREELEQAKKAIAPGPVDANPEPVVRVVVDYIASMSEQEALALYQRLEGISFGSFLRV